MRNLIFLLMFSCFVFASYDEYSEYYSENFSKALYAQDFDRCDEILENWQIMDNPGQPLISMLKASICFSKGEIELGKNLLHKYLPLIPEGFIDQSMKDVLNGLTQSSPLVSADFACGSVAHIVLCKKKQPKGVGLRYWFGVAQVVAGCVVTPFNPAVGGGLIATGISTVVHAGADCIDNKEKWENEQKERQKMDPDFSPSSYKKRNYEIFEGVIAC